MATGRDLAPTLRFAERLAAMGKPTWVRFTLVPGLTDDPANVEKIARFVAPMKNVEWVEVQPFHQLGAFKWKAMKLDYKHADTPPATPDLVRPGGRAVPRSGLPRTIKIANRQGGNSIMIDLAQNIIGSQPILALFLAIGVGYLVGQINLGGFSLGVGAVLFVGLAIGAFAPKSSITGPIGLTGLIMFLYGIGILYGRQFFEGMTGAAGRKYNLLALVACLAGLAVALGLGKAFDIKIGHTLGIYAGSMTSTATLQAALDVMKNTDASIGYSIAYPFGVIGPISVHIFHDASRAAKISAEGAAVSYGRDYARSELCRANSRGSRRDLPDGVQVTMVRKGDQNIVPAADLTFACRRRCHDRSGSRGGNRRSRGKNWKTGGGAYCQRSFDTRLHPRIRREGRPGRDSTRAAADAGRLSSPFVACTSL